jgi:hypothetical protein
MKEKQLALIKNPEVKIEDHSMKLCLWFDASLSEGRSALLIVPLPELACPDIRYDVSRLEGKVCWVVDEGNIVKFLGWWRE